MTLSGGEELEPYDEAGDDSGPPGSPSSDNNSWSSADTARAADNGSPGGEEAAGQRRPKRCKISREQLNILIKSFDDEPLPNFDQRQALAKVLGMTPRSVQIWFQNRRQRLKPMQPKAATGGCELPSSSQLPYSRRPPSAGQPSQPSFGMPGLAAVAGLCNGYSSELMSKAVAQLPLNQPSGLGSFVHSMSGLPYDVMEPFAATKALLGAGYQPPASLSLASRLGACSSLCGASALHSRGGAALGAASCLAAAGASAAGWEPPHQQHQQPPQPASQQSAAGAAAGTAPAAAAAVSQKAPAQADGLLLLLACAGDGQGQAPPVASSEGAPAVVTAA